jgi:hypothetical protein
VGKYARCTASRISIRSSFDRPDCTNCGYVWGYIILYKVTSQPWGWIG